LGSNTVFVLEGSTVIIDGTSTTDSGRADGLCVVEHAVGVDKTFRALAAEGEIAKMFVEMGKTRG
jgi:hypothetical protein